MKNLGKILFTFVVSLALVEPAVAAESTVNAETQYVFNTFLFLVCGFLVMFMAPGFAMLECGLVTSRSVSTIAAKKYWIIFNSRNYVLASWLQSSLRYSRRWLYR